MNEWVDLIKGAKNQGLNAEEVRDFLKRGEREKAATTKENQIKIDWESLGLEPSAEFENYIAQELEYDIIKKVSLRKDKLLVVDVLTLNDIYSFRYSVECNDVWHHKIFLNTLRNLGFELINL